MTGRISDERFTELSADYEAEQRERKEKAAALRAELSKAQEATVNAEKFGFKAPNIEISARPKRA